MTFYQAPHWGCSHLQSLTTAVGVPGRCWIRSEGHSDSVWLHRMQWQLPSFVVRRYHQEYVYVQLFMYVCIYSIYIYVHTHTYLFDISFSVGSVCQVIHTFARWCLSFRPEDTHRDRTSWWEVQSDLSSFPTVKNRMFRNVEDRNIPKQTEKTVRSFRRDSTNPKQGKVEDSLFGFWVTTSVTFLGVEVTLSIAWKSFTQIWFVQQFEDRFNHPFP